MMCLECTGESMPMLEGDVFGSYQCDDCFTVTRPYYRVSLSDVSDAVKIFTQDSRRTRMSVNTNVQDKLSKVTIKAIEKLDAQLALEPPTAENAIRHSETCKNLAEAVEFLINAAQDL